MAGKRKPETLSVEKKGEIVWMLVRGYSRRAIAKKYGVSQVIVDNINPHTKEIEQYLKTYPPFIGFTPSRLPVFRLWDLDNVLYAWCIRCMKHNIELTEIDIQKKAMEFNIAINGCIDFTANSRWLQKFRKRNCFNLENIKHYFPTPNKAAGDAFGINFYTHLLSEEFKLENVYNVGYTPIMWKALPEEILTNKEMCEDHVTVLFCTNATGSHKLPLLIIGKIVDPQSSNNLNTSILSFMYKENTNALMDSTIFNKWFTKCFLKSVKERQEGNGRREKILLLVDNSKLLPDPMDLNEKDKFVTVMSPPLKVSSLKQPINCGIIASFRRKYRISLLQTLASLHLLNTEDEVIDIQRELNTWDYSRIAHYAWSYLDNELIIHGWRCFFCAVDTCNEEYSNKVRNDVDEAIKLLHDIPGCGRCNAAGVSKWFIFDNMHNLVMKIYTDEVLRDFENNTLYKANKVIDDDEAMPPYSQVQRKS